MSISRFFTVTISNTRMSWSGDSPALVSVGSFTGHVQQATPEAVEFLGEALGTVFTIWCAKGTDVQKGDTITIASGDYSGTYSVKAIQKNATGSNEHLEITIIKDLS